MGRVRFPEATRLLITADGGGSNGHRVRLWKLELAKLARETGLDITVCHYPPGTSKWNRIEHKMWSFISMNWRGRPLVSYRTIIELISATTTATGLTIRASWIAEEIEAYVAWLDEQSYGVKSIWRRVPTVYGFGEFARLHGAATVGDLPGHVEAFVADRVAQHHRRTRSTRPMQKEVRGPVEQMLTVVLADFCPTGRPHHAQPFADVAPGFFDYLVEERGLRPASLNAYRHHLDRFAAYLARIGVASIKELSPPILSAFIVERAGSGLAKSTVGGGAGALRVFLRYLHREGVVESDLSGCVGSPQVYRLSNIPRSISWEDVNRVLAGVDRRTPVGRRDYAILLLLVTYGLRGREIAALTLDDIDWKRERLAVPERKAGHSTAFPLSTVVGEALVDYLRRGRPETADRHVFFRAAAPRRPLGAAAVSAIARNHLLRTGVDVPRPGSHTLRHSAVQRLEIGMSLEAIAALLGHRSPRMTLVYARISNENVADQYFQATQAVESGSARAAPANDGSRERAETHRRLLGNGHCTRPLELDCRFQTICEGCGFFDTGPRFVEILRRQCDDATDHVDQARAKLYGQLIDVIDASLVEPAQPTS